MPTSPLLEAKNIFKVYPNGVVANQNVNFSVKQGEIHALAGENGAGKSTLMKILFGMEQPDRGELLYKGKPIILTDSQKAISMGLGMVHQHFMLVPSCTVTQNIILGIEPKKGLSIDYEQAVKKTQKISEQFNLYVDPLKKVEDLSVGMKQKVEILKALYRGATVLILDEPTAVLTPQETDELFIQLKKFKESGFTVIFISHKLKEIKAICDRITVMRNGKDMGVYNVSEITETEISRLMIGRDVSLKYTKQTVENKTKVLEINDLVCKDNHGKSVINHMNLCVKQGEILGIAGVDGNGQSELAKAIMGEYTVSHGSITINKSTIHNCGIHAVRKLGVSYVPEDRLAEGIAGDATIDDNLISNRYNTTQISTYSVLHTEKIKKLSENLIKSYCILCKDAKQRLAMLSGGNMQKVVVAREFSTSPKLLIAEQLTRGVDVGSAQFIHEKLLELKANGTAILLISADLNEVTELSDRLAVMYEGQITAVFDNPTTISEENLGLAMLGMKKMNKQDIRRTFNE
ncbi:MAG: ABC transporter ATP-binding protein [Spirochaetales bacterium]